MAARLELNRWIQALAVAAAAGLIGLLAGRDPGVALTVSLSLAFVLVAWVDLTAGLIAFTLLIFLEFILPEGPALTFTRVGGLLLALAWLAKVSTEQRGRELFFSAHPALSYALAVFLSWGAISLLWAESMSEGLEDLFRFALNIALFVIVFTAVQRRRQAEAVLGVFIFGAAVTAIYALVFRPTKEENAQRLISTVGDPNTLAAILVAGLMLSAAAIWAWRGSPAARFGACATAAVCLPTLVQTGSRSGVLALGGALIVAVLVAGRHRAAVFVGVLATAAIAVVSFLAFAPAELRERVVQISPGEVQNTEARSTIWQVGWRMVEDQPVRGVGVGNFQAAADRYVLAPGIPPRTDLIVDDPQVAHNAYLHVLAELGVVGLALFLAILGFSVLCALRAARIFERLGDDRMEIMSRALVAAVAGILIVEFFVSEQFNNPLWLLLGLGPGLLAVATQNLGSRRSGDTAGT